MGAEQDNGKPRSWSLPEAGMSVSEVATEHAQDLIEAAEECGATPYEALLFSLAGAVSVAVMQAKKATMTLDQLKQLIQVTWTKDN